MTTQISKERKSNMSALIFLVIVGGGIYVYRKYIRKDKFRVMMADPITGQRKCLSHIDGLGNNFEYTVAQNSAMIFSSGETAEHYAQIIPDNITTVIEIKQFTGWKKLDGQGL